jgi:hypothetical protein
MHSEAEFLFWEICFPFMTNNKNLGKRVLEVINRRRAGNAMANRKR